MREHNTSGRMPLVITHYCMQFNGIGDEGVRAIARALKYNTCISHLDLSVCSEEVAGVEEGKRIATWRVLL